MNSAAPNLSQADITSLNNEAIRLALSERKAKSEMAKRCLALAISNYRAKISNYAGSEGVADAYLANARRTVQMEAGGNLYFCRLVREATTFE